MSALARGRTRLSQAGVTVCLALPSVRLHFLHTISNQLFSFLHFLPWSCSRWFLLSRYVLLVDCGIDRSFDALGGYEDRRAAFPSPMRWHPLSSVWHSRTTPIFVDLSSKRCEWLAGAFQPPWGFLGRVEGYPYSVS